MDETPIIETVDVRKQFGEGNVLNGSSEKIYKGDKTVIIGASGSRKSTFLRCLNLLEPPTSGTILFKNDIIFDSNAPVQFEKKDRPAQAENENGFSTLQSVSALTVLKNITLTPCNTKTSNRDICRRERVRTLKTNRT